ncbi:MAG: hypothetical protein ACP5KW_11805 [Thermoproteota archaeon]|jgi:hypothetical protein
MNYDDWKMEAKGIILQLQQKYKGDLKLQIRLKLLSLWLENLKPEQPDQMAKFISDVKALYDTYKIPELLSIIPKEFREGDAKDNQ